MCLNVEQSEHMQKYQRREEKREEEDEEEHVEGKMID